MRPDASPNACWTSFIGAPMHDLGTLPEKCFTCAAKQREVDSSVSTRRTMFMGPSGARQLPDVPTVELLAWLERSERMLSTPETPIMQEDVRDELRRRDTAAKVGQD